MIRLKDLREDRDLSQKDVADILNISQTNYSKYELEKIEYLRKLSLYFNTSIDYILGMTNEISPYPRLKNISSTDNCSK